jgi:Protein of unknown function (DUF3455)
MPAAVRPHRRSPLLLLFPAALLGACASAPLVIPGVPAGLEAPGTVAPVLRWFAKGTQNYTCTARADGSGVEWKLTAPEAVLFASDEPNAARVGTHGAGPSWTALDGSRFIGDGARAKKVPSPEAGSIPWLLVPKKDGDTTGTLGGMDYVQRLNTVGGQPPATGCDPGTVGAEVKVPYTATYVFYRAA